MGKMIVVGNENFDEFIREDGYYVDKTELLYELVAKTRNKVTLFTRPRRFGKTLIMSMMESFFDINRDSKDVFEGLDVSGHSQFCAEYMNRYPVVFISLKDVEGRNFKLAYDKLKAVIADVCKKFDFLGVEDGVNPFDKEIFLRLQAKTACEEEIQNSLKTVMRMMHAVYGKPAILLIDEYDVPLAKAHANGYYHDMLDVLRGMMSASLKTNDYLKFAVATGCLRIPKESIFTGVNNFASYSVLDEDFSQYFGFLDDEIDTLLAEFGRSEKASAIKEWYDGYVFGKTKIYCPWDVVNYVSALQKCKDAKPKNYWENTSGHDAVRAFFNLENADISDSFETLLNGGTIRETVTTALTYDKAYESESNLWSVLLMTGYVTIIWQGESAEDEDVREVELGIPNREIAGIFQTAVVDHFRKTVDQIQLYFLMNALWNGDAAGASRVMSRLLWLTVSYMDYHEDYYHAFLAGIFVGRGGYIVKPNKERGLGRPDIDLRDKRNKRAMVIVAKKSDSKENMEHWCDEAIRQIVANEYAKNLDEYDQVLCYGISFYRKEALIKKM